MKQIRMERSPSSVSENKTMKPGKVGADMVHLLCGLYGLGVVMLGGVLCLAAVLTRVGREDSLYLEVMEVITFVLALLYLIYKQAHIMHHQRRGGAGGIGRQRRFGGIEAPVVHHIDERIITKINLQEIETGVEGDVDCTLTRSRSTTPMARPASVGALSPTTPPVHLLIQETPGVSFDGKDVNFYLRLGAIGFGIGSMVEDGFKFAQLIQDGKLSFSCLSVFNVVVTILHISFTFFQTFYIFKSHKIVVHRQKGFARFGFVHLVATNIFIWILTTVCEVKNHYLVLMSPEKDQLRNTTVCKYENTLSWKSSPYLYPCTAQYSIICAAILIQMYLNIGRDCQRINESNGHYNADLNTPDRDDLSTIARVHQDREGDAADIMSGTTVVGHAPNNHVIVDCDKAHRGLFLGLLVLVLTLVAVSCYFVLGEKEINSTLNKGSTTPVPTSKSKEETSWTARTELDYTRFIFFIAEMSLLIMATSAVLVGFAKFRTLHFENVDKDTLQIYLLLTAVGGVALLECFQAVSGVTSLRGPDDVTAILSVCSTAALLIQSGLQTVFILDAMRRTVSTQSQMRRKPGRTIVTFLVLANISLFVLSLFEEKKIENWRIHAHFYGQLAWIIITHLTVPVTIFFRFHSGVCLADIWMNAYKNKVK